MAETGSITDAANALYIAQSAVSVAISNLERDLSIQLFIRHHAKGVQLTRDGEQFLVGAKELLNHASEINTLGKDLGSSITGTLSIGCFSFIAPFFLPSVLREFANKYPEVNISLEENNNDAILSGLLSGKYEVSLLYDLTTTERLDKTVIASYHPYVILPEGHRLARHEALSLKMLESDPMVLVDLPHSREYMEMLARFSGARLNVALKTGSFEMVRGLVGNGLGYSILNQRLQSDRTYDGRKILIREFEGELPPLNLILARVAGTRQSQRSRAFADVCRGYFAKQPQQTPGRS